MQLGQLKMSFLLYCEILPSSIYKNPMGKKNYHIYLCTN